MSTETETPKTRTITLTNRPPVRIIVDEWPVIAAASDDSYAGNDYGRHQQALAQGELDEYTVRVRQHADGRMIVYAVLDGAHAWTHTESRREGELLTAAEAGYVAASIRDVGRLCGIPDRVIRYCIADLPAEKI